jgi:hypothetical protein
LHIPPIFKSYYTAFWQRVVAHNATRAINDNLAA